MRKEAMQEVAQLSQFDEELYKVSDSHSTAIKNKTEILMFYDASYICYKFNLILNFDQIVLSILFYLNKFYKLP